MPPKVEFQRVIHDDAEFKEVANGSSVTLIELHQNWCGPCACVKPYLWKMSLDDDTIVFATAPSDKINALKEHATKVRPVFLIYAGGHKLATVEGVDMPAITAALAKASLRK